MSLDDHPRVLAASIAVCLAGTAVVDNALAAPALKPQAGQLAQAGTQRYIVRFAEPALATYNHSLKTSTAKNLGGVGQIPMKLKANGRDAGKFGIEGWLRMNEPDPQRWGAAAAAWRKLGADMVMIYPMYRIESFDGQIELLRRFKEVAGG